MRNRRKTTLLSVAGAFLLLLGTPSGAQLNYGSQLMTPEERARHRATMRSLSPDERETYRAEHHEEMKKRAKAMGLSLPDQPPPAGMGLGRGMGPGSWGPGYGWGGPGYGRWGSPWGPGPRGRGWRRGGGW